MKNIGNEIYIQRGEDWSLDFAVRNPKGHPFVVLKAWQNPYLAITVTAALYEQRGDFRETYWLDLKQRYTEQENGDLVLEDMKRFISAEVLFLPNGFSVADAAFLYGQENGGKVVLDSTSDFDVTNFLFFTDVKGDGQNTYKFVTSYELDETGEVSNEVWTEYDFRVIKQFNTKSWMEQGYLYDIKLLAGESTQEHVRNLLAEQGVTTKELSLWSNEDWENYIVQIADEDARAEVQQLYDDGVPLMPSYDTKGLLLNPTPIYVSVNIQGGVK